MSKSNIIEVKTATEGLLFIKEILEKSSPYAFELSYDISNKQKRFFFSIINNDDYSFSFEGPYFVLNKKERNINKYLDEIINYSKNLNYLVFHNKFGKCYLLINPKVFSDLPRASVNMFIGDVPYVQITLYKADAVYCFDLDIPVCDGGPLEKLPENVVSYYFNWLSKEEEYIKKRNKILRKCKTSMSNEVKLLYEFIK